jgi:hypothetical protein
LIAPDTNLQLAIHASRRARELIEDPIEDALTIDTPSAHCHRYRIPKRKTSRLSMRSA